MQFLWTGVDAPTAFTDLILCRDVYHCPPKTLDEQEAARVLEHLECLEGEAEVHRLRAKRNR